MNIHPAYRARLTEILNDVSHHRPTPSPGTPGEGRGEGLIFSATLNAITLTASIRPGSQTVIEASFTGASDPVQRALLESLCSYMEGKPLQECADHALIVVERSLRDPAAPPPVPGLLTPDNADPAFALPQRLIRLLLENYRAATGYAETKNFHDPPPSSRWRSLSDQQRADEIRRALDPRLHLSALDGLKRVVLHLPADLDAGAKRALLVDAEKSLQQNVEPTLHVVAEVRSDRNVLRLPRDKKAE